MKPFGAFGMLAMVGCASVDDPSERSFGAFGENVDRGESYDDGAIVGGPDDDPDEDGYTNAEEQEAGTNPNYAFSHPYSGDYRIGFCRKRPDPTGPTNSQNYSGPDGFSYDYATYKQGDVADNFTLRDQYGEMVDLYSFCGNHVMLVVGAGWCGPCRQEAGRLQSVAEEYPEAQIIQILAQDSSENTPSLGFVQGWADQYGFENVAALGVVSAPTSYEEYFSAPSVLFEDDGYIPTIYHLDDEMKVVSADQGVQTPDTWL